MALAFAPALALFRRLRFASKAALISVAFVVPLSVLTGYVGIELQGQLDGLRDEQEGTRLVAEVNQALRAADALRRSDVLRAAGSTTTAAVPAAELDAALARLEHDGSRFLAEGRAREALKRTLEGRRALAPVDQGLAKVYAAHAKLGAALNALLESAADASGLTLDPEADSYSAMDAAALTLPELADLASRMAAISSASSQLDKPNPAVDQELARLDAMLESKLSHLESAAEKVAALHAEWKDEIATAGVVKQLAALRDVATDSPGGGGAAQAGKVAKAGGDTVTALWAKQAQLTRVLDTILADRLAMKTRHSWGLGFLVFVCISIAAYLFVAFFLVIRGGLRHVRKHLVAIGQGDLSLPIDPRGSDEVTDLLHELHTTKLGLTRTLRAVHEAAGVVAATSTQLQRGTADMAARSVEAAERLQSSASAVEQINATVSQTHAVSRDAASLAERNAEVAHDGGAVITEVVQTMQRIHAASKKIEQIIGTIDSIAFQTNILALNAAVEAARAGESGRGFAVVATEVRQLAQRSAGAAREIKSLIVASVSETERGASVAQQAGTTIREIVDSAGRMREALSGINTAAQEQAAGVGQVHDSVTQLDRMTQRNASLVQETSSAAVALHGQAAALLEEAARFKLVQA